jgi:S-adenosylmethionine hydrolase
MTKLLTFLSDFGTRDSYVSEVKGVIHACDPWIRIIDITHCIEPGNLTAAAFVLLHSFGYFVQGAVHLAVIDPGVGSSRDILAVKTKGYVFVGPDNGVLFEAVKADGGGKIYALEVDRFLQKLSDLYKGNRVIERIIRQGPSFTFHGRDLFAPLAGYILGGGEVEERTKNVSEAGEDARRDRGVLEKLEAVARKKNTMVQLEIMQPSEAERRVSGKIVYIDRFGNLISNITADLISQEDEIFIKTQKNMALVGMLKHSYSMVGQGVPLALIGSRELLEIAVNGGSAKDYFAAGYGDDIMVLKKA